jgi:hypothetical protein
MSGSAAIPTTDTLTLRCEIKEKGKKRKGKNVDGNKGKDGKQTDHKNK